MNGQATALCVAGGYAVDADVRVRWTFSGESDPMERKKAMTSTGQARTDDRDESDREEQGRVSAIRGSTGGQQRGPCSDESPTPHGREPQVVDARGGCGRIAARTVQGVGAALMNPATLSIITATFPPRERGTAIGIWAGVSALALAIGPLVGGLLTEQIDWSWIFFINVPVGVLGVRGARRFIDET